MSDEKPTRSLKWMVVMLSIAVAVLGWMFMAAGYAREVENWRPAGRRGRSFFLFGLIQFLVNGVVQIPNAWQVTTYTLKNRIGFLIIFAVIELGVLGFGILMARLERIHARADRKFRRLSGE